MKLNQITCLEDILRGVADNTTLNSSEKVYRDLLNNFSYGVITVTGPKGIGRNLFMMNMAINLAECNDIEQLFIVDDDAEEMAIRMATSKLGRNFFMDLYDIGRDYILGDLGVCNFNCNIWMVNNSAVSLEMLEEFYRAANGKKTIIYMESPLEDVSIGIKELINKQRSIVLIRRNEQPLDAKTFRRDLLFEHSDRMVSIRPAVNRIGIQKIIAVEITYKGTFRKSIFFVQPDYENQRIKVHNTVDPLFGEYSLLVRE